MKYTFFAGSAVGYVEHPQAIYTRGIAHGLSLRGNDVRIVEERQNPAYTRTLREAGADASRHFYDHFRTIQHHTFEPRSGAPLLEWVTRELALLHVAVVVDDAGTELCRWVANVAQPRLVRAYLTFDPASLTDEIVAERELEKFDVVLAPSEPQASIAWRTVLHAVAQQDSALAEAAGIDEAIVSEVDPIRAAEIFERALNPALVEARP